MSRVYFHSLEGDAEVRGSERAYMGCLVNNITLSILDPRMHKDKLLSILPDCYLKENDSRYSSDDDWARSFSIWFSVSFDRGFLVNGKQVDTFGLALNTAYKIGNDAIRLMARIHGQCEIHCWIPGRDRAWIAGIIESGLKDNLFRGDSGWEDVIKLLTSNQKTPVVLSYGVCDGFPNTNGLHLSERQQENFYNLPIEIQWRRAFNALKKGGGLKICRETWNDFYFNDGMTAMDIVNKPIEKQE